LILVTRFVTRFQEGFRHLVHEFEEAIPNRVWWNRGRNLDLSDPSRSPERRRRSASSKSDRRTRPTA
jgi:hypothetical protein